MIKLKIAQLPRGASWLMIYGISLICGIGFTMSLFIGSLAFGGMHAGEYTELVRVGVLCGSVVSGLCGYLLLRFTSKKGSNQGEVEDDNSESSRMRF